MKIIIYRIVYTVVLLVSATGEYTVLVYTYTVTVECCTRNFFT